MAGEKFIDISACPKCGENHPKLLIHSEQKIIFRGPDLNMAWIVVECPRKNEEFKVRIRRKA